MGLRVLRWTVVGILLALLAAVSVACGTDNEPVATPPIASDRPTFLFFFTEG